MNVKLLVGIALFVIGIAMAVMGIAGVGDTANQTLVVTDHNTAGSVASAARNIAVPAAAGLLLAIGALLMGLSLGNWKHPRTRLEPGDEVVNPEGYQKMKHV
jgi:hypothetical protein